MMPNITRGTHIAGLMAYLVGPGRFNEHSEQRLIAGDGPIMTIHGYAHLDPSTAQQVAALLDAPRAAYGTEVTRLERTVDPATGAVTETRAAADVWHCSLSLRAEEGELTDEKWGEIAQSFVDRMGFTEASGKAGCRWVAVRHGLSTNGNDHIHIAVSLVREDGTKASTHKDFKRAQEISRELEIEHGLETLESRQLGLGERGLHPAEQGRADREQGAKRGQGTPDVYRLERAIRAAATASLDEAEFVRRCRGANLLVRPRFAAGRDDVVAGYSVALRPTVGQPIWYGGGRLARDLTLPRLREGWPDSPDGAQAAADEWKATSRNPWRYRPVAPGREANEPNPALWAEYAAELGQLREKLRGVPVGDRATWAHAARETAGVLAAWSTRVEDVPGELAQASRQLAKSAHIRAHQSRPKPTTLGSAAGAAMVIMQATSQGPAAEAIMLRHVGRISVALLDMHSAAGDARRAEQLRDMMNGQLAAVQQRLLAPEVPPSTSDAVRLATQGTARPTLGSPVPRVIDPTPKKTPAPHVERGDHGLE
jgi:hypothetical protein